MNSLVTQPSISISCIETRHHQRATQALMQTLRVCKDLPVKRVYWYSNQDCPSRVEIASHWPAIDFHWIVIEPFAETKSFNRQLEKLTLELLPKTVETDFNLIIQADGYAANAQAWTDAFYRYDYIGASWWWDAPGQDVGNGGFSWRSKKLYQALLDLRSRYCLADFDAPLPKLGVVHDKFLGVAIPEDNLICKVYRPMLEKDYGIRFAPVELADQFSIETKTTSPWLGKSFGFHGKMVGSFYVHAD